MADDDLTPQDALIWRARAPYTPEQAAVLLGNRHPNLIGERLPARIQDRAEDIRRHFGRHVGHHAYDTEDGHGPTWVTLERLAEFAREYEFKPVAVLGDVEVDRKPTMRDDTLVKVIAALLSMWPGGKNHWPSGKDAETAALGVGIKVSDDSIRYAFELAKEMMPK